MPIYAYRCERCGHSQDVIQKFSDAPLKTCTACGADAFAKQLTAPSFQLKGSGWYVTDFRDSGKAKSPAKADAASANADGAAGAGEKAASTAGASAPAAGGGESAAATPTPTPSTVPSGSD
jgi:putative FmdB family regulatory protein